MEVCAALPDRPWFHGGVFPLPGSNLGGCSNSSCRLQQHKQLKNKKKFRAVSGHLCRAQSQHRALHDFGHVAFNMMAVRDSCCQTKEEKEEIPARKNPPLGHFGRCSAECSGAWNAGTERWIDRWMAGWMEAAPGWKRGAEFSRGGGETQHIPACSRGVPATSSHCGPTST